MRNNIDFYIPFEGFYGSSYEAVVDDILESELDEGHITNEQLDSIDYKPVFEAMSIHIFDEIIEYFIYETDVEQLYSINITYEGLSSPKYYNYSTDKLKASITYNDYSLIYSAYITNDLFLEYVKEESKSRDGFVSFYEGIEQISKEPGIFLEYLFNWFVLSEYRDEIIERTCDNMHEVVYNNLTY